ncbi:MAG: TonB-dependent receptor [Flavobacteriaceae bacterium]|nr:TonB-dependent receptor [Flavobacteriaceae bacterium]
MKKSPELSVFFLRKMKLDLKMKLTWVFILSFVVNLNAITTYSQKTRINLNHDVTTIEAILNEIEKNTEFSFVYKLDDVNLQRKVSVDLKNKRLNSVLEYLFDQTDTEFLIFDKQVILRRENIDEVPFIEMEDVKSELIQFSVRGTVSDETGQPLPGAAVVEKGTTNGTQSDLEGNFIINLQNEDAVLTISYIGLKTVEIEVNGQTQFNVVLQEDTAGLDEVVLIGYGTARRSDVTGALERVDADALTAFPVANVEQGLKGRAAGVNVVQTSGQPGAPVSVQIRGGNSITGDNSPLYVLDGFPISGGIDFLNPSDVQSIDILKDASATAIYGARGANGVIIITTKSGQAGKSSIEWHSYYSIQEVINTYDLLNGEQYAQLANTKFTNSGEQPPPFNLGSLDNPNTDWQDVIFRTAAIQNHNLTFNGGNEKTTYSTSFNYFQQEGIIISSGLERGSLRLNINHKVNDWVRLITSMVGTRERNQNATVNNGTRGNNVFSAALAASPLVRPLDQNGNPTVLSDFTIGPNVLQNPLSFAEVRNDDYSTTIFANAAIEFQLTDDLKLRIAGGSEQDFAERNFYSPSSLTLTSPTGTARTAFSRNISYLNENTLSFDKILGEGRDNISAVFGFTFQNFENKFNQQGGVGFINDILENNALGSAETTSPNVSSVNESKLLSWLGRVNYSLNDKYLFTASVRADGSSRFGENNKWAVFPSGAFAWKLNNEPFFQDSETISDLKLRLSYGETGNQSIPPFGSLDRLAPVIASFGGSDVVGFAPSQLPNEDLKWETTAQFDAGIDIALHDGKYRFTLDFYHKQTRDLLVLVPLAGSTGFSEQLVNSGDIKNTGLEFSAAADFELGEFEWNVSGQISMNQNEVTELPSDIFLTQDFRLLTSLARVGQPLGVFYGFVEDGLESDGEIKYVDFDKDGVITNKDQRVIGDPYPDFIIGLNNTFSWKKFQLNMYWQGSIGNELFWETGNNVANSFNFDENQIVDVLDHWSPANTTARYPIPSSGTVYRPSDRFVHDASYVRLKNIQLTYHVTAGSFLPNAIESLQVYVSGQNLMTITDYVGLDPEVNTLAQTGSFVIGADRTGYPSAKIYTLGLNIIF